MVRTELRTEGEMLASAPQDLASSEEACEIARAAQSGECVAWPGWGLVDNYGISAQF